MSNNKPLIVITGVSGRIGFHVAKKFSQNFQVIGLDVISPKEAIENMAFYQVDLSKEQNVLEELSKVREKYSNHILSVIHLAAYYNFSGGAWEKYQEITIDGTHHLLKALEGFDVEQFLFSSTILVYAPCKLGEKISEASPLDPKWEYPLSKVKTEKLLFERFSKKSVILRIAGVYDDYCHSIPIAHHIERIWEKQLESHFFPGNAHHGSSFVHMEDLIQAISLAVEKHRELAQNEIFIIGEKEVLSFLMLQKELGVLIHNQSWWTIRIPKWVAKLGAFAREKIPFLKKSFIKPWMIDLADDHYDLDISKAEKILGWEPVNILKNSLQKMIKALKENPEKWYQEHGLK